MQFFPMKESKKKRMDIHVLSLVLCYFCLMLDVFQELTECKWKNMDGKKG